MSDPDATGRCDRLGFWGVARGSLLLAAVTAMTACLDGTPEYQVPTRAPPVVEFAAVVPSVFGVNRIDSTIDEINFRVPFRSEDAGEELEYFLILDFDPNETSHNFIGFGTLPLDPRPFDEQERLFSFDWSLPDLQGKCHSVMLLLTHSSNRRPIVDVQDEARAQRVVWWFYFEDGEPSAEFDCHFAGEEAP